MGMTALWVFHEKSEKKIYESTAFFRELMFFLQNMGIKAVCF